MDRAKIIVKNQINIINNNSQHGHSQNIQGTTISNHKSKIESSPKLFEMYKSGNVGFDKSQTLIHSQMQRSYGSSTIQATLGNQNAKKVFGGTHSVHVLDKGSIERKRKK